MWTSRTAFTAIAVAVLATACGGGGDDAPVAPPAPTYVKISAANQDEVARVSIASIVALVNVPVAGPSAAPALAKATQAGATSTLAGSTGLTHLIRRVLDVGPGQTTAAGLARPLAQLPPETVLCSVSGSFTTTLDDKDNSKTLSVGDSVSISFNQCDEGDGPVNGGMGLAIATYSATPTSEALTGSITFQSLSITSAPLLFVANGGASFNISAAQTATGFDMLTGFTVASGGLTLAKQALATGAVLDSLAFRAGFTVSDRDFMSTAQGVPSSETITASGDFGSQSLGGDLTLSTITPFKSVYTDPFGDIFPTEGQLLVSGRDGTKLRLTATQTVQVLMEMSDDSDADWESTKFVTWDWLFS